MKFKNNNLVLGWGILHFINDAVAGFIIASFSQTHSIEQSGVLLIVYTILGFGGQLPVAMWLDKTNNNRLAIRLSLLFLVLCTFYAWSNSWLIIIVAGLSSAFLHVTGGKISLEIANDKTSLLGIFTAPGVLGLTTGIAVAGVDSRWLLLALPVLAIVVVVFDIFKMPAVVTKNPQSTETNEHSLLEGHDLVMILILLTVTVRSLLYEVINVVAHNWQEGILVIGISAFVGKIVGGFLADRIGWKRWVYITLPLAFIFLQLGEGNLLMLAFGVACLQSSIPISLMLMHRTMPHEGATATALTFGVAIAVAGLLYFIVDQNTVAKGWFSGWGTGVGFLVVSAIFLYFIRQKRKRVTAG